MNLKTPMQVKRFRQDLGMTQRQFGEMIGRDDGLISKWESGKSPIPDYLTALVMQKATEIKMKRKGK